MFQSKSGNVVNKTMQGLDQPPNFRVEKGEDNCTKTLGGGSRVTYIELTKMTIR